jgi:hypothetical protein
MSILSAVLFIHVLSAMSLFAAFALEAAVLLRIRSSLKRRAGSGGRSLLSPATRNRDASISWHAGQRVISGVPVRWRDDLDSGVAGRNAARHAGGRQERALVLSYGFRLGLVVGIVFLMTAKPGLELSVAVLAGAALVGVMVVTGLTQKSGHRARNI